MRIAAPEADSKGSSQGPIDEEALLEDLLNLDADGYELSDDGTALVHGSFEALEALQNGLREQGWSVQEWEHCWHPLTQVTLQDSDTARQCLKLLEVLEDLDDVSSVSANLELAPDLEID